MKVLTVLIGLMIFFTGCASKKSKQNSDLPSTQEETGALPDWTANPDKVCMSVREICTVGEGPSKNSAENDALKNLATFFETKVSSTTTTTKDFLQKSKGDTIVGGELAQEVSQEVKQTTDNVILKGIEYKKRYVGEEFVYVLASLHRRKVGGLLRSEIQNIDEKLLTYLKQNKRSYFRKMLTLYRSREKLNNYHELLRGARIPKKVSYDQVHKLKLHQGGADYLIYVQVENKDGTTLKSLQNLVVQSLVDSNYKVTTKSSKSAKVKVYGKLISEKQFMNVDGFVKYKYVLNLYSENLDGIKVGALSITDETVGRNADQAYHLAIKNIGKKLIHEDRISDLELK